MVGYSTAAAYLALMYGTDMQMYPNEVQVMNILLQYCRSLKLKRGYIDLIRPIYSRNAAQHLQNILRVYHKYIGKLNYPSR
jgi:hypothetical protein